MLAPDPRSAMISLVSKFLTPVPTHYATLTFRKCATRTSIAVDSLRLWLSLWNKRGKSSPISSLLWSAELQQRGTAHIHALLICATTITSPHCSACFRGMGINLAWPTYHHLKESWYCHHGIARIYPFDQKRAGGCAGYVTKYILSDECCDWGLWTAGKEF